MVFAFSNQYANDFAFSKLCANAYCDSNLCLNYYGDSNISFGLQAAEPQSRGTIESVTYRPV